MSSETTAEDFGVVCLLLMMSRIISSWDFQKSKNRHKLKVITSKILGSMTKFLDSVVTWCPEFINPIPRC
jgi:hypothetical protein